MNRTKLLLSIVDKLAVLDAERQATDVTSTRYDEIQQEIKSLRQQYQDVMNSPCPVIKD